MLLNFLPFSFRPPAGRPAGRPSDRPAALPSALPSARPAAHPAGPPAVRCLLKVLLFYGQRCSFSGAGIRCKEKPLTIYDGSNFAPPCPKPLVISRAVFTNSLMHTRWGNLGLMVRHLTGQRNIHRLVFDGFLK